MTSDEIFVINVGGYIGSSTRSEIEYAKVNGKPINYLEPDSDSYHPDNSVHSLDDFFAQCRLLRL